MILDIIKFNFIESSCSTVTVYIYHKAIACFLAKHKCLASIYCCLLSSKKCSTLIQNPLNI